MILGRTGSRDASNESSDGMSSGMLGKDGILNCGLLISVVYYIYILKLKKFLVGEKNENGQVLGDFQKMYKQALLYSSVIFSVGGIIGAIVFGVQDSIFTLSSVYGFYWFVAIMSLLISVGGVLYHEFPGVLPAKVVSWRDTNTYGVYIISAVSILMSVFWLSAAAAMGNIMSVCLYLQNSLEVSVTCKGEIVATTFGFAEFVVFAVVSYYVGVKAYKKLVPAPTAPGQSSNVGQSSQAATDVQV